MWQVRSLSICQGATWIKESLNVGGDRWPVLLPHTSNGLETGISQLTTPVHQYVSGSSASFILTSTWSWMNWFISVEIRGDGSVTKKTHDRWTKIAVLRHKWQDSPLSSTYSHLVSVGDSGKWYREPQLPLSTWSSRNVSRHPRIGSAVACASGLSQMDAGTRKTHEVAQVQSLLRKKILSDVGPRKSDISWQNQTMAKSNPRQCQLQKSQIPPYLALLRKSRGFVYQNSASLCAIKSWHQSLHSAGTEEWAYLSNPPFQDGTSNWTPALSDRLSIRSPLQAGIVTVSSATSTNRGSGLNSMSRFIWCLRLSLCSHADVCSETILTGGLRRYWWVQSGCTRMMC